MRLIAGLFFRLSNRIPRKVLTVLYYSLIHSKIPYCNYSWGNAPKTHIQKLTKFQKKNICIIFKKPIDYPSFKVFKCSKLLSIDQLYQLKFLLIHYSIPPQLIPLTITLLEALCLISLLPSLRPLLGKDVFLINYHFYGTIYLVIMSNSLKFKTSLKNRLLSS